MHSESNIWNSSHSEGNREKAKTRILHTILILIALDFFLTFLKNYYD